MPPKSTSSKILWGQTNEQIRQKWSAIFQSKVREFDDKWIVHYEPQLPDEEENWEEPLVESSKITFKCKECDSIWTLREGSVYLYFRRSLTDLTNKVGEVFIWIQDEICPKCSTNIIPEINVERSEINAVLHYLMMEIGYFYYKMKYTKDEEEQVEETRMKKTRQRRRRKKKSNNPTLPIPNAVVNKPTVESVKKVQPKSQQIIQQVNNPDDSWAASSPGPSSPAPAGINNHGTKSATKTKSKKKTARNANTTDDGAAVGPASNPSTRKKRSPRNNNSYPKQKSSVNRRSSEASLLNQNQTNNKKPPRWNKTPEQIRNEWQLIFDGMFQQFITKRNPEDKWTFELIDAHKMKEYQLKQNSIFKNTRALIGFHCSMCPNIWESLKGRVTFWIRKNNNRRSDGKFRGGQHVYIFINGQKCQMCSGSKEDKYENGDLIGEEIERVLSQVLVKIEIKIYGKKAQVDETGPSTEWIPRSEHKRELCQACFLGICELVEKELTNPLKKND